MRKSEEWKVESLECMAQEPQWDNVRQEMGICKLELFRSYVYISMYVYMYVSIWHFTSRVGRELDIPQLWDGGEEVTVDAIHVTKSSKML